MPRELFDILSGHPFDGDHCFLCGADLNQTERTYEHVFPRWLQERFGIRDKTLTLLNGTNLPYRNLVIPCCKECNGVHLSRLEGRIRSAVLDDDKSLAEVTDADLNAWVSKIFVGILWKELELSFDRKNPDAGPILPPAIMENFRMVHMFMQACRKEMTFHTSTGRFPNTLLRVVCKPTSSDYEFDYLDSPIAHSVGLRLGTKAILAVFDGGLHNEVFPDFADTQFKRMPLNAIQFKEVFVRLSYKSVTARRVPYFGFTHHLPTDRYSVTLLAFDDENMRASTCVVGAVDEDEADGSFTMIPILPQEALDAPAYGEWSQEDYARALAHYTGLPFERLFLAPDRVATFLWTQDGQFADD